MSVVEQLWQGKRHSSYSNSYTPSVSQLPKESGSRTTLTARQRSHISSLNSLNHGRSPSFARPGSEGYHYQRRRSTRAMSLAHVMPRASVVHALSRTVSAYEAAQELKEREEVKTINEEDGLQKPKFKAERHEIVYNFVESKFFSTFILIVIILNTAVLISTTWDIVNIRWGWYFQVCENIFLGIYIMEMLLKQYVYGCDYFSDGWNILDFVIVLFSLVEFMLPLLVVQNVSWFGGTKIFRLLRVFRTVRAIRAFRVLRAIRFLSNLQVIMITILQSIKSIGAIVILISLFMYMFAVIGRGLYSEADPQHFGNLFLAWFTMFQLLTLDDWFDIYIITTDNDPSKWHVILYLLLYIVVEYFVFLNLFVAVLVDNFQLALEDQSKLNATKKKGGTDDSDDEDFGMDYSSEDSSDSDLDFDETPRQTIDDIGDHLSQKDKIDMEDYLRLLVSIDYNMYLLTEQQRLLNVMVDMCMETSDDV